MIDQLINDVWKANIELSKSGLVIQTWGNVSGIDRSEGIIVIKPSGVPYNELKIDDMVSVDFDGKIVKGTKRPSSDTPTHIELYKAFPKIEGVTHTHSTFATVFAQACSSITCLGTTHADTFSGSIPVTRFLTQEEIEAAYEKNTGSVIIERFGDLNYIQTPGVLVAGHAPFCWGKSAIDSVNNSIILENVAKMAFLTYQLNPEIKELPEYISQKHFLRKHGPNAYYGQKK
jgi:L-ribulose-5-phosphate 4-epimerase